MKVVQCWDDGVGNDVRLCAVLRKHGATASFNINAGLHRRENRKAWTFKGTQVERMEWECLPEVYEGFTIAGHGLTHQRMADIPAEELRREAVHGRERLQEHFRQEVLGFAYPYGSYNEDVKRALRGAGYVYARTCGSVACPFPPADAFEFHPNCHFLAPDFWQRYERAREGGVFYFWGHSYEIVDEAGWEAFDGQIGRIAEDPAATWAELPDLFR